VKDLAMIDILRQSAAICARHIKELADQEFDPGIVRRVFESLSDEDAEEIRSLIISLTDLIGPLGDYVEDATNLPEDRLLAASAFNYLIMPFDLIPENEFGIIGYLDDAIYAYLVIDRLQEPSDKLRKISADKRALLDATCTMLPDWFMEAVERSITQTCDQLRNQIGSMAS
jgi:uncharacterized membrane protein YkvA (DUF1232 family)